MSLTPGTRIGTYDVGALIGAGGMGEVYRARDTTLNRDVALKVLPELFASDADRLARFRREAQTLASLNHPNIAAIYGFESGGTGPPIHALVLELVEGPTLAERLARGAMPLAEVLRAAGQIAEALEAAHEKGIVHRDLKPANIKITPGGGVKVLDFGLAKAVSEEGAGPDLSHSPTITAAGTRAGVILGTAAYMSPEQARGHVVDKRADIWAFGCVLCEMLTGRAPFARDTLTDTLAAVVEREPQWDALPAATPPTVRRLLARCLEKDSTRRLRDIGDARIEIEDALKQPTTATATRAETMPLVTRERLLWTVALMVAVAAGTTGSFWYAVRSRPVPRELRVEITTPPTGDPFSLAVSPDGTTLAFVAPSNGTPGLWLRSLGSVSVLPLAGTDNASGPFWSPDSRSIGFFANGQLKRVDLDSKSVRVINPRGGMGATWNQENTVLFARGPDGPLMRVSADGGEPIEVLRPTPRANVLKHPAFLPDGRHFLFHAAGTEPGVYLGRLDASEPPKRILDALAATYAAPGHLLFVRQGTLFAQAFDPVRLELAGDVMTVTDRIITGSPAGVALSVSAAGPIAFRTGSSALGTQFVWFDRSGKAIETVAAGTDFGALNSSMSPDGRQLAISRSVGDAAADIWLLDLVRGVPSRFTSDKAFDLAPVWSHDGRIAFASNRRGTPDPYMKAVSSAGDEQLLVADEDAGPPSDWSADDRFILYARQRALSNDDIWALPLDGDRKPFPVVETSFDESNGQFSPDGRWITYQSNESGQAEIYLHSFSGPRQKIRISSEGGVQARWRNDGREIFYVAPGNRLVTVPVQLDSGSATVGTPMPLFPMSLGGTIAASAKYARQYIVSQDGQRFLVQTPKEQAIPITVILNWMPTR